MYCSNNNLPTSITTTATPYTLHSNIPYTITNHHPRQVLDLYLPTSTTSSPHPLVLYIHGGAFRFGDKTTPLLPRGQLSHGYALAALNYRRSGEAIFPAMIADCKSAIRFLKSATVSQQFNLDSSGGIIVWGDSAGGHAAAFCGTTSCDSPRGPYDIGDNLDISSSVVGVVDYYGPTDFRQMDAHLPEGWQTHNNADSPESLYLGGQITLPEMEAKVREADPCTYVSEGCPEFFVAHGTVDRIVPEFMSELLVKKLKDNGMPVEYLPVEGADHVFEGISEEQQEVLDKRTDNFLRRVFGR